MPRNRNSVPTYRLHKPSGQAFLEIRGQRRYLGKWDSDESRECYARVVAELATRPKSSPLASIPDGSPITVVQLIAHYWEFAQGYYVKNGRRSPFLHTIRLALRGLRQAYGSIPVNSFGPLAFQAIQHQFVSKGLCRGYSNQLCAAIRRMFKWGVSQELVPPSIHQALATVPGLRRGRTEARETAPVLPVGDDVVDATLPFLPPVVDDMVRFQRLTGCRPGEVCSLRPCDLDRSTDVWSYRPAGHKTEHLGRERVIWIGPQAQEVLLPYLLRAPEAFCFAPAESEAKRLAAKHEARKTPLRYGNRPGSNRKARPKRKPQDHYVKDSYGRAVRRAVDLANRAREEDAKKSGAKFNEEHKIPRWHPNQLRHSVGTRVRKEFGLEGAQVVLGHAKADVTQVYAERDGKLAAEIMKKIG